MSLMGVKCIKCGLIQMAKETCKSCGSPLMDPLNPGATQPTLAKSGSGIVTTTADGNECCGCGQRFSLDEMIRYKDSWVCARCKPVFVQKLKEGVSLPGVMEYAGFWLRLGAKTIDGMIVGVVSLVITLGGGMFLVGAMSSNPHTAIGIQIAMNLFQTILAAAYATWFIGKYGATPGKMACNLKVVAGDGGKLSYGKACSRHFSEYLSAIILGIGYLMSAFDPEKRALHDRMCNTRVVRA